MEEEAVQDKVSSAENASMDSGNICPSVVPQE